jgi:putative PIN family toxin of toxin-antitoxin system
LKNDTAKPMRTVLIDTNILISGLVFTTGNEHRILKLAENKAITLLLPEFVLEEARTVLDRQFPGHGMLLDAFLRRVHYSTVSATEIDREVSRRQGAVRDTKDAAVLASVLLKKPNFAVTGDKTLREDMKRCRDVASVTEVCSSIEFLTEVSPEK